LGGDLPLWTYLCSPKKETDPVVFSGHGKPIEISEADAIELAPLLGLFIGEVVLSPLPKTRAAATGQAATSKRG
jgi:hypothetical protein